MAVSTGAAILGGSLISGAASVAGGKAAGDAADQAAAVERARLRELQPFRQAGVRALPQFEGNIGQMPTYADVVADLESDPGYQFELGQGQKAIEGAAAARGLLRSGRTLKDLVGYAQGLASTRAGEAFSRELGTFNNKQNQLLQLIEAGRGASGVQSGLPNIAMTAGQNRADMYANIANTGTNALQNLMLANYLRGNAGVGLGAGVAGSGASANTNFGGYS